VPASDTRSNGLDIGAEQIDRDPVCLSTCTNSDVERGGRPQRREQLDACELAQSSLEFVAIDCRVLVAWHHDSNARKTERGSENPHIEVHGSNSLPLSNDVLYVLAPRQPMTAREP
jgi:hypothetical protein